MQGMMDLRGQMMGEMEDHAQTMAAERELEAARSEVAHHTAAMAAMLDRMGGALGELQCEGMH